MQQVGSFEYATSAGDTWDILALKNYNEERLASLIIQANPRLCDVIVFDAGTKVTIPVFDALDANQDSAPWR